MKKTPKTNLGCESEFGHVTNDLSKSGGSLSTISDKHTVARNKRDGHHFQIKKNRKNGSGQIIVLKQSK